MKDHIDENEVVGDYNPDDEDLYYEVEDQPEANSRNDEDIREFEKRIRK